VLKLKISATSDFAVMSVNPWAVSGHVSLLDGTLQTEMSAIFTHLVLHLTTAMLLHTNRNIMLFANCFEHSKCILYVKSPAGRIASPKVYCLVRPGLNSGPSTWMGQNLSSKLVCAMPE
jgi:hypothetical protein